MEDYQIVDLYWKRDENAITATRNKYGRMLYSVSYSLLSSREDAEECENDTYLDAWNAMPTERPAYLGAFLTKIVRRISVDRFRRDHRRKRGGMENLLSELDECIPATETVEAELENGRLRATLEEFLLSLTPEKRVMFVRRYVYAQQVEQIAQEMAMGTSKVKVTLLRTRRALRQVLEERGLL